MAESRISPQRTYASILVDALTAGVAVVGFVYLGEAIGLSNESAWRLPITTQLRELRPVDVLALFAVCFHFLLDDWQLARRVDALSPDCPSPFGVRFYLDVVIAGLFVGAFWLSSRGDARLLMWFSLVSLVCVMWSYVVFRAVKRDEVQIERHESKEAVSAVASTCLVYVITHSLGALFFMGAYGGGERLALVGPNQEMARGLVWLTVGTYLVWDLLSRWIIQLFPGLGDWLREKIGCGLYRLASWLLTKARQIRKRR